MSAYLLRRLLAAARGREHGLGYGAAVFERHIVVRSLDIVSAAVLARDVLRILWFQVPARYVPITQ
jgi:hypothetical protein